MVVGLESGLISFGGVRGDLAVPIDFQLTEGVALSGSKAECA